VFALGGVPISFWAWYRGLYFASQKTQPGFFQTAAYARFFLNFLAHVGMACWMLVGVPVVGDMCAGIFSLFELFGSDNYGDFLGVMALVNVVAWGACLGLSLRVGREALERFKEGGGVAELRRGRDAGVALASAGVG
jgi:secretory carrier-associated membrane protein